jgi:dTDP-4-amino-4,6-dideoxygalactose transaminase
MYRDKYRKIIDFTKGLYKKDIVPLNEPIFLGNEEKYVLDTNRSSYLSSIFLRDRKERNEFLEFSCENGILCRPFWVLMDKLSIYKDCFSYKLENTYKIEERLVNIPMEVIL